MFRPHFAGVPERVELRNVGLDKDQIGGSSVGAQSRGCISKVGPRAFSETVVIGQGFGKISLVGRD